MDFLLDLFTVQNLIALLTLSALEIVLGIDNIVFIAILTGKLPPEHQKRARQIGLMAAMVMRVLLLLTISWMMKLTQPLFSLLGQEISGKDLILLVGGLFLLAKATWEIHDKLEGPEDHATGKVARGVTAAIVQIMLVDLVFSLDSVITAVGMVDNVAIMIVAVVLAVIVMMIFANPVCAFIERHPTVKMLALSFLILIGVMLVAESFEAHIGKGYIYFAMGFSLFVEMLNIRVRRVHTPVHLHSPQPPREQ
jgi:predicted tellurium resistance membrane protein TerC